MRLRTRLVVAALLVGSGCAAAPPRPHVDPEAIREARHAAPAGRSASPRAIAHYLEARRRALAGDWAGSAEALRLAVGYDGQSPELRVGFAQALALAGQIDPAEAEARRALELDGSGPTAVDAEVLLGKIQAARKRTDDAILAFRRAIRIETALAAAGWEPDAEPWRLLSELYLDAGDEAAALRVLEDGAAKVPGDSAGFREAGRGFLERRDLGRAERYLARAVQTDPRDLEALRLLAQVHEGLHRDPEARDDQLAVLRLDPDDDDALHALGRIALRADDVDGAREWFRRQLRAAPDPLEARLRIAFEWLEARRPAEALAVARDGLAERPDPRLRLAAGLALEDLRRWSDAAAALAAVKPDAGDVYLSARASLAYALSRAGRHAEAVRALDGPLAARPGEVRLVTMRALVLDRAGRSAEAVDLLRRALADKERAGAERDAAELLEALADTLARDGRAGEAVEALRAGVAAHPKDESLLYALATAYDRAGKPEDALAQAKALLALDPDHADALNFVGYAYAEKGVRLDEAERLVRRALELRPRSGYVLDSLGWVHYRRGEFARAVEVLEKADGLAGPEPTILEHLGDAYRAAARPADAAAAYRRALKSLGEESPAEQVRVRAAVEKKLKDLGAEPRPVAR